MNSLLSSFIIAITTFLSCAHHENPNKMISNETSESILPAESALPDGGSIDTATFGTGCFWCTEAIFQQLKGVLKVSSGYSGGHVKNPTYKEVCEGTTGHAEVIQITYDPKKISFDELLKAFWESHDPTTPNRQGNDVGPQYRSVIFYHNEEQKQKSEKYKAALNENKAFDKPVITEISPFSVFYVAENYHQDYYNNNGSQPYCQFVIRPKLEKFRKVFKDQLKN